MTSSQLRKPGRWLWTVISCVLIVLVASILVWMIGITEPTPERVTATKRGAVLVDVVTVERGTYRPVLTVLGTVEPRQELVLNPEVGGRVIELSDAFEPGTVVDAGEILLQIDPADYELRLAHLRTDLQAANAELKLEMGQQEVARQEFSMVQQDIAPEAVALVLREPQLESAKARVAAAEVAIAQAQLDLERTRPGAHPICGIGNRTLGFGRITS